MTDIQAIIAKHHKFYLTNQTKAVSFRVHQLKLLKNAIKEHEQDIFTALKKDLNKSVFETYEAEIAIVNGEIDYMIKHLRRLSRPKYIRTPILHFPSHSRVYSDPYGTVLIMSPWNYPLQLSLAPLAGSIAAGNCTVLKPSEYSFHTSELIEKIIKECFDESYISVIRGGREANKSLLNEKFDFIFFTGSPAVGKLVMTAAAKNLTPITLELGGKSPCVIDETANIPLAAKRIVWGKLLNAGQTCVAPDYLLVHRSVKGRLIEAMKEYIIKFYGSHPMTNEDYPKIINKKHFDRLLGLMKDESIVTGGKANSEMLKIEPTILDQIDWSSKIMQEEIFGPIFPVITYDSLNEILNKINALPSPLAFYYFSKNRKNIAYALRNTAFGGGCINDTIIHLSNANMGFGGVGESGMGQYHGKASFEAFSHQKSIMKKSNLIDIPLRYPPFGNHLALLKKIMK